MISAEAPVLFAKAAEIFISELSLRAWIHTEDNKRRTLQVCHNDLKKKVLIKRGINPTVNLSSLCNNTGKPIELKNVITYNQF